jgi:hypothetical protein
MDKLKDKLKSAVIVLAAVDGAKVQLAAGVTADLVGKVKAGELVNFVASQVGGKGGGKADMAMAGGTDAVPSLPATALAIGAGGLGLAVAIVGLAEDDFRDVVGEALQCIDSQGPRPFWWATLSDEVAGHGDDATKLCSALGLGAYAEADRVLVFDYTVADAGLLYRPTTLDGGGYAFHFPSPVAYPQGLSMALRDTETHCTELLHHALAWDAAADCVRPRVLSLNDAWTRNSVYADLPKQRQRHRLALLVDHPGSKPWLERHHHRL